MHVFEIWKVVSNFNFMQRRVCFCVKSWTFFLVYTYIYMRYLAVCTVQINTSSLKNIQYYVMYMLYIVCFIRKTIQLKCIREVYEIDVFFIEYWFYWFNFSTRLRQISDHLIQNTCSKNLIHFSRKLAHYQQIESGSMEFI